MSREDGTEKSTSADAHLVGRKSQPNNADAVPNGRRLYGKFTLRQNDDDRSSLCFSNFSDLPFTPRRHFVVTAPAEHSSQRGGHAHRTNMTVLQCLAGTVEITFDDGHEKEKVVMGAASNNEALVFGPLVWSELAFSAGAVVLALCSTEYDEADYIRNYEEYLNELRRRCESEIDRPKDPPTLSYFAHERAIIDNGAKIGRGTRVWANAHIQEGAVVGDNCNIGEGVFVETGAVVGRYCTVKNGVTVYNGVTIEDGAFIASGASFCNDILPRSQFHKGVIPVRICRGASLGANCVILPGVTVGEGALVGAGSVVAHDVEPWTVVVGNPAKFLKRLEPEYVGGVLKAIRDDTVATCSSGDTEASAPSFSVAKSAINAVD